MQRVKSFKIIGYKGTIAVRRNSRITFYDPKTRKAVGLYSSLTGKARLI